MEWLIIDKLCARDAVDSVKVMRQAVCLYLLHCEYFEQLSSQIWYKDVSSYGESIPIPTLRGE